MGTRNTWTDKEIALLERLALEHVERGGVIDETFARSVERRIPRHPWSGVVRKLQRLAREHVERGGVIDETFARSVERRIPRHPRSGVVRKLHTLGYRARTGMAETTNAAVPARKETNEERTLTDAVERLISALEGFRRAVARQA